MERKPTEREVSQLIPMSDRLAASLRSMLAYLGLGSRRLEPVDDLASLRQFLETRASFIAQTSLYGYLRTRMGMRYPELFDDDPFVVSINVAKWHVWLACLSDLAVYAGGMLARHPPGHYVETGRLMQEVVARILDETGVPDEADAEFPAHAERVRARIADCDWTRVTDDEQAFSESPQAVVRWAPIVDELKQLDEEIVMNSVRFRWQEVRRDLRQCLDAEAVLRSAP
ncbi:MAG: esterase [Chromatiales bacterium]|jgi:hypothetical protein|nr:esterase [Chromatiales bacterium]MDX9766824.1 esterase [Ectothiorhodospiraceae bacterium]